MADVPEADEAVAEVLDPAAPTAAAPVDPDVVPPVVLPPRVGRVALGCGVAMAALTVAVAREQPGVIDLDLALHGAALAHRGPVDSAIALGVTWAGATYVALPALLVVGALAAPGRRRVRDRLGAGLLLVGTASVGIYAGLLLNHVVGRARPPAEDWWGAAGGPAFPSGHTTAGTVVWLLAAWALVQRWPGRRRELLAAAVGVAAAVGWSRVWLGVHWPSDVLGGWLFGTAWALGAVLLLDVWRRRA
jgi:membrane-associated phospholipid phosphatase